MTGSQQLILGEGAGGSGVANYIEDVFSTWLYTGNGSTQTITNGIDLSTKGGLVWIKRRNSANSHFLFDTARGVNNFIQSDTTAAAQTSPGINLSFNSNGWSQNNNFNELNLNGSTYASWTFRKQPKFFDVVTWSGNNIAGRQIPHSLGSVPGCIIVKNITSGTNWQVYHRSLGNTKFLELNTTAAEAVAPRWNDTTPTSTVFTVGSGPQVNSSPNTYVAYLFAHNAGGFGLTGTDNVISCGSYTPNGTSPFDVNLGFEPQWVMIKSTFDSSSYQGDWNIYDNMRGMPLSGGSRMLWANSMDAEYTGAATGIYPTATGFTAVGGWQTLGGGSFIYIAIRRGPMKTPTTGTSVYNGVLVTGNGTANRAITGFGFPLDLLLSAGRTGSFLDKAWNARLTNIPYVRSTTTAAEDTQPGALANPAFAYQDGYQTGTNPGVQFYWNLSGETYVQYGFRRAPGFFDVVCFQGDGSTNRSISHNLGVAPELIITKSRNFSGNWHVGCGLLGWTSGLYLDTTNASSVLNWYSSASATAYVTGSSNTANRNGYDYVVHLFASCPGVSKVGSYTGTGALQTINCGFTGGARWVMIKRTDSTGDWWVYDSARGISSSSDPYLFLNTIDAEVTGTNYVDTTSVGFQVTATAPAGLNANGGTYIFLAIA